MLHSATRLHAKSCSIATKLGTGNCAVLLLRAPATCSRLSRPPFLIFFRLYVGPEKIRSRSFIACSLVDYYYYCSSKKLTREALDTRDPTPMLPRARSHRGTAGHKSRLRAAALSAYPPCRVGKRGCLAQTSYFAFFFLVRTGKVRNEKIWLALAT